jgi:DNA polymerase-3 subunit alpha
MASLDQAMQAAEQQNKNAAVGQSDLFGAMSTETRHLPAEYATALPWRDIERLQGEKETLGFYLSGHPMQSCEKELASIITSSISQLQVSGKSTVTIAGMMLAIRPITTRSGKRMAVMTVEDSSGRIDVTLFSELYQQIVGQIDQTMVLIIRGTVSADEYTGGIRMVADSLLTLEAVRQQKSKRLTIVVENNADAAQILNQLPNIISPHNGGHCPVTIAYRTNHADAELALGDAWRVKPSGELLDQLSQLCGAEKIKLDY